MIRFTLRPMAPSDAAPVAALIRAAFGAQSVATDPPPSALRVTEPDITGHLQRGGGAVAVVESALVGSALWIAQDDALYLARLAVDPALRRGGIAKGLVATAEAAAYRARLPVLRLSTRLALLDNRRLFATCGFVETTREAHPGYTEPTFVNMEKRLSWEPGPG